MPKAEIKRNEAPPRNPANMGTKWCFFLELFLTTWVGVEVGEGEKSWCDSGGTGVTTGGFTGGDSGIGSNKGDGEGVRKMLEGDADGEEIDVSIGDGEGESDSGDDENGESEGKTGEGDGDGDGEKLTGVDE